MGDQRTRELERKAAKGDFEAQNQFDNMRRRVGSSVLGYDHLLGQRIVLLGARWHYEGILDRTEGKHLILTDCRQIFNYTLDQGVTASDKLTGEVVCNHTHVASASVTPFTDKPAVGEPRDPVYGHVTPGYNHLVGKRVLILGARWHYDGILKGCAGDYLILDQCRQIFNYTLENGIAASDELPGLVACNWTHVASANLSPFPYPTKEE